MVHANLSAKMGDAVELLRPQSAVERGHLSKSI